MKRILVIYSYHEGLPWERMIDDSLRRTLATKYPGPIDLNVEHADRVSHQDDEYLQKLIGLYRRKYSDPMMDLVICIDDEATEIVLKYGDELFTGVPTIFVAAKRKDLQRDSLKPNMTSLSWEVDFQGNATLIQKILPETRHLFVISGSSLSDRAIESVARKTLRKYRESFQISYLTDMSEADLLERVARLPEHSVLFYLAFSRDAEGKSYVPREIMSAISEKANAPMFGIIDSYLGHGIVGGSLLSAEEQGRRCAELALLILKGEKPVDIYPKRTRNLLMFDWRQLRRWSISEHRLPTNSIVRFKEFTLWDRYKGQAIAAIAFIVFQALIIFYLLHQHRIRRRAEQALDKRLQFERLIAEISSEFSNLASDKVDRKINDALSRIGTHINVERSFLFRFNWEKTEFRISHLWEAEGVRQDQVVRGALVRDLFPWLADNLPRGKDIVIPDVEELSDLGQARKEYEYCRHIGIRSFLILPIQVADSPLCAIGLDSLRSQKKWTQEDIRRLRILGEVFANTIAHNHHEKKRKAAELKYRTVADFTYDWEYWANVDGKLEYISPSCERISGYSLQDFMDNPALIRQIIVPQDIESWDEHDCASENELKPREIQLRIQRRDGETRWIEHVCQPVVDNKGSLAGFRASNRDITERKHAELELRGAYTKITELKDQLETESAYLQEEIKLEHNFENIIGQSQELKYVLYQVEQVAATDSSVLILGETGTGKELVARAIHKLSSRSNRVLVKVNCAALPAELIESELFGREKGAFTGASTTQIGRFELAKGSTILLDEIGELPLTLQAKLLRVLESGEFERLGSPKTLYSNARIITATNRVLEEEVRQGRFREDLWYRLKVFTVTLPPLSQRKADIPLLIKWFMDQLSRKMGKPAVEIPKHTIQALQDYHWPGNVRELKNMVESALITARGNKMNFEIPQTSAHTISDFIPFEEMERDYIFQVLKAKNWKVQGTNSAASVLGMNPNTLRARLKKLGIKKPSK